MSLAHTSIGTLCVTRAVRLAAAALLPPPCCRRLAVADCECPLMISTAQEMRSMSRVRQSTAMASLPHQYPSVAVEMQQFSSVTVAPSAGTNIAKDSVELIFREVGYQVQVATTAAKKCACAPPYSEDRQTKTILKGVTGIIRPHRLTCILGASGAGKTSLLNILSGSLVSGSLSGQLVRPRVTFSRPIARLHWISEPLVIVVELTRVFCSS
jgi:hypothetical protein